MEVLGLLFVLVGAVLSIVGGIWFLVVAFKESILWGLAVIFIPFVGLIFLVLHWKDAGRPFGISLLGSVLCAIGAICAGAGGM